MLQCDRFDLFFRKFQKMGKKGPEKGKDKSGGGDNRDDDPSKTPGRKSQLYLKLSHQSNLV